MQVEHPEYPTTDSATVLLYVSGETREIHQCIEANQSSLFYFRWYSPLTRPTKRNHTRQSLGRDPHLLVVYFRVSKRCKTVVMKVAPPSVREEETKQQTPVVYLCCQSGQCRILHKHSPALLLATLDRICVQRNRVGRHVALQPSKTIGLTILITNYLVFGKDVI